MSTCVEVGGVVVVLQVHVSTYMSKLVITICPSYLGWLLTSVLIVVATVDGSSV